MATGYWFHCTVIFSLPIPEDVKPEAPPSPPPPTADDNAEKKPSAYVPPNRRNQPSEPYRPSGVTSRGATGTSVAYRGPMGGIYRPPGRRGNAPPDIENTEAFPTLGGTTISNKS